MESDIVNLKKDYKRCIDNLHEIKREISSGEEERERMKRELSALQQNKESVKECSLRTKYNNFMEEHIRMHKRLKSTRDTRSSLKNKIISKQKDLKKLKKLQNEQRQTKNSLI